LSELAATKFNRKVINHRLKPSDIRKATTMLNVAKESKHSSEEVMRKAIEFFGPNGLQLEIKEYTDKHLRFEGGGGFVEIQLRFSNQTLEAELLTQEWEYQVKEFLSKI
jgi:hypothetical protein